MNLSSSLAAHFTANMAGITLYHLRIFITNYMDGIDPRQSLAKQGYHLFGSGAVKPCLWLNRALRGGDQCYKRHFYGISSHRCVQMTPTLECNQLCLHCWRPIEDPVPKPKEWTEPDILLEGILQEQQRLLSGYGGAKTTDMARL